MTSFVIGVLVGLFCMLVGWAMAREDQKLTDREKEKNAKKGDYAMIPCKNHVVVPHRDAKEPWCNACGLNSDFTNPKLAAKFPIKNEVCSNHAPTDNDDGKEDWCWTCGLTSDFRDPKSLDSPFLDQAVVSIIDAEELSEEQIRSKILNLDHEMLELSEEFNRRMRTIKKSITILYNELNRNGETTNDLYNEINRKNNATTLKED